MLEFKDNVGNLLQPGDLIAYSIMYGQSPGLKYGKVLDIVESKGYWYSDSVPRTIKLKVIGAEKHNNWSLVSRPSSLENSDRIIHLNDDQIPTNAFNLLKEYKV